MAFTSFQGPDFTFEKLQPDGGPLAAQLVAWYHRATAAGRVPCVYLTAVWCPPSVQLERSLVDPRMQKALRRVDAATFDIDVWGEQLKAAGFAAHTVPIFFVLDAAGKPTGPTITGGAWGENTPENMAPPLERFFDRVRPPETAAPAPRPTTPAYAAPPAAAPASAGWVTAAVTIGVAAALIAGAVWIQRSSRLEAAQAAEEAARAQRIREDADAAIRRSLAEQKK
jgi:hypothetical protein